MIFFKYYRFIFKLFLFVYKIDFIEYAILTFIGNLNNVELNDTKNNILLKMFLV